MIAYRIHNRESGQDLGRYMADTPEEAIRTMLRDARCTDEPDPALVATPVPTSTDPCEGRR